MVEQDHPGSNSKWTLWSLGVVVAHKPFGTDIIQVTPHERLPLQSGQAVDNQEAYVSSMASSSGEVKSQNLTATETIEAIWVPDGENHLYTSPMVRKNEIVKIYKYADDQNNYYWTTLFQSTKYRRLERVVMGASDVAGGEDDLTLEDLYSIDFNTIDKSLTIKTVLRDGEQFAYVLILDPSTNTFRAEDNVGNTVKISSADNNVSMYDASGGIFETRDGHPRIYGPKGILLETPADVVVMGDTEFKDNVIVRGTTTSVGTMSLNSGLAMQQGNGGSGGEAIFDGDITIRRTLTVTGTSTFNGHATFNGGTSGT